MSKMLQSFQQVLQLLQLTVRVPIPTEAQIRQHAVHRWHLGLQATKKWQTENWRLANLRLQADGSKAVNSSYRTTESWHGEHVCLESLHSKHGSHSFGRTAASRTSCLRACQGSSRLLSVTLEYSSRIGWNRSDEAFQQGLSRGWSAMPHRLPAASCVASSTGCGTRAGSGSPVPQSSPL